MSKQLVITGLAQETDLDSPEKTKTLLVINKGELRIPVDETSVQQILEYALKDHQNGTTWPMAPGHVDGDNSFPEEDDYANLADKEREEEEEEFPAAPDDPSEEVLDDTGISQL